MKRFLTIVAMIATLSVLAGCKKTEKPVAEFAEKILTVYSQSDVTVTVNLDKAAEDSFVLPVEFTSKATMGEDYIVSESGFIFTPGKTSSSIILSDNGMAGSTTVTLKLIENQYVDLGTNYTCVVTRDADEALIYSFSSTKVDLIESANVTLTISGEKSGAKFKASEDIEIPFVLEGDGAEAIDADPASFVVKKGTNSATVAFTANDKADDLTNDPKVTLKIDNSGNSNLTPGEVGTVSIKVHSGMQTPSKLVGTWTFSEIYDLEDIYFFAEADGFDPESFPFENDGFTLTITENEETGEVTLSPSGNGAFNWFFRESTMTLSDVMNIGADGEQLGQYTSLEANMYMFFAEVEPEVFTHYSINPANRSFDATTVTLGPATIAIALSEDGTSFNLIFKDYDLPPFLDNSEAEVWYDGTDFDSDILGFGCKFVKAE